MNQKKSQIFFPNLDALRFFCFLSVFFFHSFATAYEAISTDPAYQLVKYRLFGNGNLGVNFFFVLSGFLITYLLLAEKTTFQKVHIGNFYMRRVLRIWPLFYFCVFFGFVLFPVLKRLLGDTPQETANPWYYLFFINNFDFIRKGIPDSSVLSILWSVAIEEQFYLFWPLVVGFTRRRWLPYIFGLLLLASFAFRLFRSGDPTVVEHHTLSCISDLTVGGIGALLSFQSARFLEGIRNLPRLLLVVLYACVAACFLFRQELFEHNALTIALDRLVISVLFLAVILEQNFCDRSLFQFKSLKTISRLGQYTYGLYCLHMIGILIAATVLKKLGWNRELWQVFLLEGGLSLIITILLAYTSYHFFEKRFLLLKNRFAYIKTNQSAQDLKNTQ